MKWLKLLLIIFILSLSACVKVGQDNYKEGTYYSYDQDSMYSVVIYINGKGLIKSVFFDAIYLVDCATINVLDETCTITTKQELGANYGMKEVSAIDKEWDEQVDTFANKVIENQGIDWLTFKYRVMGDDGKYYFTDDKPNQANEKDKIYTDSVAGVTIVVDNLYRLVAEALKQAKK